MGLLERAELDVVSEGFEGLNANSRGANRCDENLAKNLGARGETP